jgi:hypothetical protein
MFSAAHKKGAVMRLPFYARPLDDNQNTVVGERTLRVSGVLGVPCNGARPCGGGKAGVRRQ